MPPSAPMFTVRSVLLLVLGVSCGILLPFVVRSWVARTEASVSGASALGATQPTMALRSNSKVVLGGSDGKVKTSKLQLEKEILLKRLKEVEHELEALVTNPKSLNPPIALSFKPHTPTYSPTYKPTLRPTTTEAASSTRTLAGSLPIPLTPSRPAHNCKYNFTVYVYPLPPTLSVISTSEEARRNRTLHVCRKCILEQFALEYIIYDFFTTYCNRVYDPLLADYFYLPLVRDAEFRLSLSQLAGKGRVPSQTEQVLLDTLEKNDTSQWRSYFNITDEFWHRKQGRDHIIVMPAPVTNFRHETNQRGFFHYMSHLYPPMFLSLEYSVSFAKEYPVCIQKNIILPYPTIDPDLYNGKMKNKVMGKKGKEDESNPEKRDYLIYYAGGMHGECVEVRQAIKNILNNATFLDKVTPPVSSSMGDRERGFMQARYCPIPVGDSPSSKRMYDVLHYGCIPVVLSDDLLWAFGPEMRGLQATLRPSEFSIQVPQSVIHFTAQRTLRLYAQRRAELGILPSGTYLYDLLEQSVKEGKDWERGGYVNPLVQILRRVPDADLLSLQAKGREASNLYSFYEHDEGLVDLPLVTHRPPQGGTMRVLSQELEARVRTKMLDTIYEGCVRERLLTHKFISRYPCDGQDEVESLLPPKPKRGPRKGGKKGR